MSRRRGRSPDRSGMVPGLILMAVGLVFLLDRYDVVYLRQVWQFWPLAVILIGLKHLLRPDRGQRSIFLLLIGVWLQISTLELFRLDFGDSWPLLIIFVGASFVFDAVINADTPASSGPAARAPGATSGDIDDA